MIIITNDTSPGDNRSSGNEKGMEDPSFSTPTQEGIHPEERSDPLSGVAKDLALYFESKVEILRAIALRMKYS